MRNFRWACILGYNVFYVFLNVCVFYFTFLCSQMATPILAGQAAIVRQFFREGWYATLVKVVFTCVSSCLVVLCDLDYHRWFSGSANTTAGFIPSAALLRATLMNAGQVLTGFRDLGCCGYTQAYGNSFVSPYPNPEGGQVRSTLQRVCILSCSQIGLLFFFESNHQCCCADLACSSRLSLARTGTKRSLDSVLPNRDQGFGRPILSRVLGIGSQRDPGFNLLLLLRSTSSTLAATPLSASIVPAAVPLYAGYILRGPKPRYNERMRMR